MVEDKAVVGETRQDGLTISIVSFCFYVKIYFWFTILFVLHTFISCMSFEEIDIWEIRNLMSRSFTCIQPWFSSVDNSVTTHQKIILNTDIVMKFNKTASFQKEAMRTQVALWFFLWSEIVCREVPLCLIKQNASTHKLGKVYCFKKIVIRMKLLDLIEFVCKRDTSLMR